MLISEEIEYYVFTLLVRGKIPCVFLLSHYQFLDNLFSCTFMFLFVQNLINVAGSLKQSSSFYLKKDLLLSERQYVDVR